MKLNNLLYHIEEKSDCVPTFFDELDRLTGGLLVGKISIIAGRPAMGKTTFAMSVVRNVGIMNRIPTAVLSLEDDANYVAKRLMATQFGWEAVKSMELQSVILTDEQKDKVAMLQQIGLESKEVGNSDFLENAKSAPVWIEHGIRMEMEEIVILMERLKCENDIRLFVIDSFGWIAPGKSLNALETAMQKLVHTAEELKIAVLITCDLTRTLEHRGGIKKPILSDLRDNALIEKFSTLIMFLYRPEYYQIYEDERGSTLGLADVIVARNRRGNTGEVRLKFENRARFDSLPDTITVISS